MPLASPQINEHLRITGEYLNRQLDGVNDGNSAGPDDTLLVIKPSASIIPRSMCKPHQTSINQGKIPDDWGSAAAVATNKYVPNSVVENLGAVYPTNILFRVLGNLIRAQISQHLPKV